MHVTLHLTRDCNMRCSYCYAPPRPGPAMTEETGRAALDLGLRSAGASCGVVFFGGEPLLHKDLIVRLVSYARDVESAGGRRFHFKLTTNGLLLDEAFLNYTLQNDVLVAMSFDGVRAAHDRHRRLADGAPSFDVLVGRLRSLLAARPYASVLLVVNPDTAALLTESVEFLLDLGCRFVIVSLNYAAPWNERDFGVLEQVFDGLADRYVRWTREGRKFYLSPFEVKLSSHVNRHVYHKERCELAERQISIAPDGAIFPCVQFVRAERRSEWCIGHVATGIDETARARVREFASRPKPECAHCAIAERCNNTCGCLNWQTTGRVDAVSPVLCRYEQIVVRAADRVGRELYARRDPLFLQKHYNAAYPVLSVIEDTIGGDVRR